MLESNNEKILICIDVPTKYCYSRYFDDRDPISISLYSPCGIVSIEWDRDDCQWRIIR